MPIPSESCSELCQSLPLSSILAGTFSQFYSDFRLNFRCLSAASTCHGHVHTYQRQPHLVRCCCCIYGQIMRCLAALTSPSSSTQWVPAHLSALCVPKPKNPTETERESGRETGSGRQWRWACHAGRDLLLEHFGFGIYVCH